MHRQTTIHSAIFALFAALAMLLIVFAIGSGTSAQPPIPQCRVVRDIGIISVIMKRNLDREHGKMICLYPKLKKKQMLNGVPTHFCNLANPHLPVVRATIRKNHTRCAYRIVPVWVCTSCPIPTGVPALAPR